MRCEFVTTDSSRWRDYLADAPHDFYHLPPYFDLCARSENGRPLAFLAEDGARRYFAPFVLRKWRAAEAGSGCLDATTPYGYPCPLFVSSPDRQADARFLAAAVAAHIEGLRRLGVVSAFFRLHPLLPLPPEPLQEHGALVHHGQTVVVDLTLPEEELWHHTRPGHRSEINRAKRNGYAAAMDADWTEFEGFLLAYRETMQRVGAKEGYFFPRTYFTRLRECLDDALHLCTVRIHGELACAGLFVERCGMVAFHLSGTRNEFVKQYPSKPMLDFVRRWAKERGNRWLHLGGGLGAGNDSLFLFKAGFSHLRRDFHTWRVVVDQEKYAEQVRWWEQCAGAPSDPVDGFFPAYRKAICPDAHSDVIRQAEGGVVVHGQNRLSKALSIIESTAG